MADDVTYPIPDGTIQGTDTIAGVVYPRAKVVWGPDGTVNDADVATGKPMPVQVRSATGLIPIGEPTDAKSTATDGTSTSAISIWKQISASLQAFVTTFGAAWTRGAGASDANTQRVTIDSGQIATLGQAAMAASAPVVVASDQTKIPVHGNTAHDGVDADKPIKMGGYAKAAAPSDVSADADVVNAWFLRNGAQAINVTAAGALIPGDATTGLAIGGAVAHDGVDTGKPNKQGFRATTALSGLTLVADADRTDGFAGVDGVQIVRPHCNLEDIVTGVATCTTGANTSGIAAIGAGIKFYLCAVLISNTGGTTAGNLSITDGSGGTEKANVPFSTVGAVENLPVPIPFTANTAVFVDPSGTDTVKVTLIGFKSKV